MTVLYTADLYNHVAINIVYIYNTYMRGLILLVFILPLTFLVFGYTLTEPPKIVESGIIDFSPPMPVVVRAPTEQPTLIQIDHQEFPFDVDGNFPYIVMVDNVVWQFKKEDVKEFVSKGKGNDRGHGRERPRLLIE